MFLKAQSKLQNWINDHGHACISHNVDAMDVADMSKEQFNFFNVPNHLHPEAMRQKDQAEAAAGQFTTPPILNDTKTPYPPLDTSTPPSDTIKTTIKRITPLENKESVGIASLQSQSTNIVFAAAGEFTTPPINTLKSSEVEKTSIPLLDTTSILPSDTITPTIKRFTPQETRIENNKFEATASLQSQSTNIFYTAAGEFTTPPISSPLLSEVGKTSIPLSDTTSPPSSPPSSPSPPPVETITTIERIIPQAVGVEFGITDESKKNQLMFYTSNRKIKISMIRIGRKE